VIIGPPPTLASGSTPPASNPRNEEGEVRSVADYLEKAANSKR
jgi:hypothetical protein